MLFPVTRGGTAEPQPSLHGESFSNVQTSSQTLDPSQLLKKVRDALNRIKPFQVRFVQQVYGDEQPDAKTLPDIEESGEILFKDDRRLKWTYLKPDLKIFLLENDNYKFYDEDNEQLTVGKIKDRGGQWIWQLFFSDDILPYARVGDAGKTIFIKKEDAQEPLNVEIQLNSRYLPVRVIQQDRGTGARMVYTFTDYKENVEITDRAFELNVPDDVEIIDG